MNKRRAVLPILILLFSGAVTAALVHTRPKVEPVPPVVIDPLVRTITVRPTDLFLDVVAQGSVLPRTAITLVAQVPGEVITLSDTFEDGAFFDRGTLLLSLDPRDYRVAVRRAEAQVAQARVQLELELAEAAAAAEEWSSLGASNPSPLALRQPQVARARANLAAAEADLEKARLDLDRTRIHAPFAGRVQNKLVDRGQYLAPGVPIASIHATDYAEIRLPVPDDQLDFLDLPFLYREPTTTEGPEVTLLSTFGNRQHTWSGRIVRTGGELDTRSRMLDLIAQVQGPYDPPSALGEPGERSRPPLAVGSFVEARIRGRLARGVTLLPRLALRGADQVLVIDSANTLRFRHIEVRRLYGEQVVISSGLVAGEQVCVSPLDVAVDGMSVRVSSEPSSEDQQAGGA